MSAPQPQPPTQAPAPASGSTSTAGATSSSSATSTTAPAATTSSNAQSGDLRRIKSGLSCAECRRCVHIPASLCELSPTRTPANLLRPSHLHLLLNSIPHRRLGTGPCCLALRLGPSTNTNTVQSSSATGVYSFRARSSQNAVGSLRSLFVLVDRFLASHA